MSDTPREPDASIGGQAVDQGARALQIDREDDNVLSPDEVVENLRRQLEEREATVAEKDKAREAAERRAADAERGRQDAEARARHADEQARVTAAQSQRSTAEAQLDAVKNALDNHNAQIKAMANAKASALSEGEFHKASEIDAEMAIMGGEIAQLRRGQADLEERIKAPPADDTTRQQQPSESDRREGFIRQQPSLLQTWLRGPNGNRYFTDSEFQADIAASARKATRKGLTPDSQAYIDFVEEDVGIRQPTPSADAGQHTLVPGQQSRGRTPDDDRRMTAAPAGGSTAGSIRARADGGHDVYLSKDEREMADRQGITHAEAARHKRDLINEGLIGPQARR